jgi:hypothetical protein
LFGIPARLRHKILIYWGHMNRQIDIENRRKETISHADQNLQKFISFLQECTPEEFNSLFIFNKKRKTYTLSPAALQQRRDAARISRKKNVMSNSISQGLNEELQNLCDTVEEFERNFLEDIKSIRETGRREKGRSDE